MTVKELRKIHFKLNPIGYIKFRIHLFIVNLKWRLTK